MPFSVSEVSLDFLPPPKVFLSVPLLPSIVSKVFREASKVNGTVKASIREGLQEASHQLVSDMFGVIAIHQAEGFFSELC